MSGNGHGWANPTPAGLVALAMACFTFFALLSGAVKPTAIPLLGIWLIGGFVVQVIVGVVELREGNSTGGNVFVFFSAFFMLVGGLEFIFKYFAMLNKWPLDPTIDGWAWLTLTIAVWLWTAAYFRATSIMTLLVFGLDIALPIITFTDLGLLAASWHVYAAYALLFSGCLALYVASAGLVNTAFNRTVFPLTKPWSETREQSTEKIAG
ncbi:MAG TPA: GPR1/FUN34/YaaH family transporter [Syntrophomonadaceae bacterium]|nr:GPR1/FUN34/YaaH family transporter [Syntrophomonadaceae bacterium]